MLNAFTGEGGTTCGGADEEPAAAGVGERPDEVTDALEASPPASVIPSCSTWPAADSL